MRTFKRGFLGPGDFALEGSRVSNAARDPYSTLHHWWKESKRKDGLAVLTCDRGNSLAYLWLSGGSLDVEKGITLPTEACLQGFLTCKSDFVQTLGQGRLLGNGHTYVTGGRPSPLIADAVHSEELPRPCRPQVDALASMRDESGERQHVCLETAVIQRAQGHGLSIRNIVIASWAWRDRWDTGCELLGAGRAGWLPKERGEQGVARITFVLSLGKRRQARASTRCLRLHRRAAIFASPDLDVAPFFLSDIPTAMSSQSRPAPSHIPSTTHATSR